MILIDSNVVVAALHSRHSHHADAFALLSADRPSATLLAAHSVAEAYVTLTRAGGPAPIGQRPDVARGGLGSVRALCRLVGLTPAQTVDALDRFTEIGIGPRFYDYLIGRTGVVHGATTIVTLNVRHMRSLFPAVTVDTPAEYLARLA